MCFLLFWLWLWLWLCGAAVVQVNVMRVTRTQAAAKLEATGGDMATPIEPYKSVAARARDALDKERREAEEKAELERQAAAANATAAGRRAGPSSRRTGSDGAVAPGRDASPKGRGAAAPSGGGGRNLSSRGSNGGSSSSIGAGSGAGAGAAGAGAGSSRPGRGAASHRGLPSGTSAGAVTTSAGISRSATTEEDKAAAKVQSLVSGHTHLSVSAWCVCVSLSVDVFCCFVASFTLSLHLWPAVSCVGSWQAGPCPCAKHQGGQGRWCG